MKVCIALMTILFLSGANCGLISSPILLRSQALDSIYVRSGQSGGNFAYSTTENHGYTPAANVVPYQYQFPLTYAVQQPIYHHQQLYTQQPLYNHQQQVPYSVISSPLYSGLYHRAPVFAQHQNVPQGQILPQLPSIAQLLPSQEPGAAQGQAPVEAQAPVQGQGPVEQPATLSQPQGGAPVSGASFDDDTVSVESA